MAQGFYETWARGLQLPYVGEYFAGLAAVADRLREWAQRAVYLHLPEYSDTDAVALIASERQIEPGPTESTGALGTRLTQWLVQHGQAGTPLGLLIQFYYTSFPGAVLVQQNGLGWQITGTPNLADLADPLAPVPNWCTRTVLGSTNPFIPASADGKAAIAAGTVPWWTFDAGMDAEGNQFCSRFGILFPSTVPDPALGTAANLARIRRIIAAWKPAKATCKGIWVATGAIWDWPPALWDDAGLFWDSGTSTFFSAE